MGKRSIRRRIEQVYENLPPLPPTLEELPLEQWTRDFMEEHAPPPALYDEDFWSWREELPENLWRELRRRIAEVWVPAGVKELSPETVVQIEERAEKVLLPYIDRYWRQFRAGKGERDQRHIDMAEISASVGVRRNFFPNTDTPEEIRQRIAEFEAKTPEERKGQDWWIEYQHKRAELGERYEDWPEEWRQFYATWQKENEEM